MDANKLAELRRIGYAVRPSCGLCKHGQFPSDEWGTCAVRVYQHEKHSESTRNLSVHRNGSCADLF